MSDDCLVYTICVLPCKILECLCTPCRVCVGGEACPDDSSIHGDLGGGLNANPGGGSFVDPVNLANLNANLRLGVGAGASAGAGAGNWAGLGGGSVMWPAGMVVQQGWAEPQDMMGFEGGVGGANIGDGLMWAQVLNMGGGINGFGGGGAWGDRKSVV